MKDPIAITVAEDLKDPTKQDLENYDNQVRLLLSGVSKLSHEVIHPQPQLVPLRQTSNVYTVPSSP